MKQALKMLGPGFEIKVTNQGQSIKLRVEASDLIVAFMLSKTQAKGLANLLFEIAKK